MKLVKNLKFWDSGIMIPDFKDLKDNINTNQVVSSKTNNRKTMNHNNLNDAKNMVFASKHNSGIKSNNMIRSKGQTYTSTATSSNHYSNSSSNNIHKRNKSVDKSSHSNPQIYELVKIYLAFFHNQDENVIIDGRTKLNTKVLIEAEGLLVSFNDLLSIFIKFNQLRRVKIHAVFTELKTCGFDLTKIWLDQLESNFTNHPINLGNSSGTYSNYIRQFF